MRLKKIKSGITDLTVIHFDTGLRFKDLRVVIAIAVEDRHHENESGAEGDEVEKD